MPIDTLKAKRRLVEEYGVDDRQAEGIVELVANSEERGVTKSDLNAAEERLNGRIQKAETRVLRWMMASVGVLGALLAVFEFAV